jgi:hypothetical protein
MKHPLFYPSNPADSRANPVLTPLARMFHACDLSINAIFPRLCFVICVFVSCINVVIIGAGLNYHPCRWAHPTQAVRLTQDPT